MKHELLVSPLSGTASWENEPHFPSLPFPATFRNRPEEAATPPSGGRRWQRRGNGDKTRSESPGTGGKGAAALPWHPAAGPLPGGSEQSKSPPGSAAAAPGAPGAGQGLRLLPARTRLGNWGVGSRWRGGTRRNAERYRQGRGAFKQRCQQVLERAVREPCRQKGQAMLERPGRC